jgi:phosphatidylglycerophosphate synthase
MVSLNEVKLKSRRKNDVGHKSLYFFASRFSIYFSWLFINLRLSPNVVTGIFFIIGLCGTFLFLSSNSVLIMVAYGLWRLHLIIDLCDGEVARFSKKFSINGAYWDYMIHSILYPLTYASICIALFTKFDNNLCLFLATLGAIMVGQTLAVKNNYYRAMLFDGQKLDHNKGTLRESNLKSNLTNIFVGIANFEGFLLFYLILSIADSSSSTFLVFLLIFIMSFAFQTIIKFILFSKNGFYKKRS